MKTITSGLILLLFFLCSFYSNAGETGLPGKIVTCRVIYHGQVGGNFTPGDLILRDLAREVLKEPWQVRLMISARASWQVHGINGRDTMSLTLTDVKISGDTMFRNFGVSGYLLPSQMKITFRFANIDDTTSFSEKTYGCDSLSRKTGQTWYFPVSGFNSQVDTILYHSASFEYENKTYEQFKARIDRIHNYHAALAILDSLNALESEINLTDFADLSLNYFRILEINRALECINRFDFTRTLAPESHDPGNLANRFRNGYRTGRTLTYTFFDELKRIPGKPVDGDMKRLTDFMITRLQSWIRRTQLMDNLQGTIYRDFLNNIFSGEPFPEENDVTLRLLEKMYPAAKKDTLIRFFQRSVSEAFLRKAVQLMNEKQFNDAGHLLECAGNFVRQWNTDVDLDEIGLLQQKAKEGVFNSFVGIAEGCLNTRNYPMADQYLERAASYRAGHPENISDDRYYKEVFSKLFFTRNTDCDQMLGQKLFAEALDCYLALRSIYPAEYIAVLDVTLNQRMDEARRGLYVETMSQAGQALAANNPSRVMALDEKASALKSSMTDTLNSVLAMQDSIAPSIAKIRFARLYGKADTALEKRQFTLGLSLFTEARKLAVKYKLPLPVEFDSLYRRNLKHYLLIQLSAATKKIWLSQFDSARMAVTHLRDSIHRNGLDGDADLDTAIVRFERKILDQQCHNLFDSVNVRLIRADRNVLLRQYIAAVKLFTETMRMLETLPLCHPVSLDIADSLKKYDGPCRYQQALIDAGTSVVLGNYKDGYDKLGEAIEIYHRMKVAAFIPVPVNIYNYIAERSNPYLTECAVKACLNPDSVLLALEYLRLMKEQQVPVKQTAAIQEEIGKLLAGRDHVADPQSSIMTGMKKYNTEDQYFMVLQRKYLSFRQELSEKPRQLKK